MDKTFSNDGYIRVWCGALSSLSLKHLFTAADPVANPHPQVLSAHALFGYSEWCTESKPEISIGWDWVIRRKAKSPACTRVGLPRSNLMLLDAQGKDVGQDLTSMFIAHWLDTVTAAKTHITWQNEILRRYHL